MASELTDKQREELAKFFERHPVPPYIDGPNVNRYYTNEEE